MRNVLLIHGDGGSVWDENYINTISKQFRKRGDTRFFIAKANSAEVTEQLKKIQKHKTDGLTVYIQAHGQVNAEGNFEIEDENGKPMSSEELFTTISSGFNRPVDIFFTSCHGGGALDDRYILPINSQIIALSQSDLPTIKDNLNTFLQHIPHIKGEPTGYSLLKQYLADCSMKIPPEIGISGEVGTIKLDSLMKDILGTSINASRFKGIISEEDLRKCISIIRSSKHQDEIPPAYYSKILSIALIEKFGEDINHRNFSAHMEVWKIMIRILYMLEAN